MKTTVAKPPHVPDSIQRAPAVQGPRLSTPQPAQTTPDIAKQMSNASTLGHRLEQADVYPRQGSAGPGHQNTPVDRGALVKPQPVAAATMRENGVGLPQPLKTGIENLSGLSMDDVQVHYNSPEPAELGALAYT
jgi:hypothetical protein